MPLKTQITVWSASVGVEYQMTRAKAGLPQCSSKANKTVVPLSFCDVKNTNTRHLTPCLVPRRFSNTIPASAGHLILADTQCQDSERGCEKSQTSLECQGLQLWNKQIKTPLQDSGNWSQVADGPSARGYKFNLSLHLFWFLRPVYTSIKTKQNKKKLGPARWLMEYKEMCCQAWELEFNSQDPHGEWARWLFQLVL